MSRNNKNARLHQEAKMGRHAKLEGSKAVSTGYRGPAQTQPKHGKKAAWFQKYTSHADYMKAQKGGNRNNQRDKDAAH